MANTHGYEFFMQEVDKEGYLSSNTLKNLEKDFEGLKYYALSGADNIGAVKNIYTETYADANRVRVSVPKKVQRESTQVTLVLYFVGEKRAEVFKSFCDYICNGRHRYWDTARKKYFDFYISEELTPSDELWCGREPYFKVDVKMNNIFGQTFDSHADVRKAYDE
jgi:hypothetical protein